MKPTKLSILNFQFSISFALAVALLLGACTNQERYYTLTGELPDSSYNGKTVYLTDFDNGCKIDSTTVDGNRVTFRGIAPDTALNCRIDIARGLFSNPILEKGDIVTDFVNHRTSGTPLNDEMARILTYLADWHDRANKTREEFEGTQEEFVARYMDEFYAELKSLMKEEFLKHTNDAVGYLIVREGLGSVELMKHVCDNSGPWLNNKGMVKRMRQNTQGLLATAEGMTYTDIKGTDIDGKPLALSDFVGKGNYVLVDFWASWCGPCRGEIPNLRKLYEKYNGKGLTILGIYVWDSIENMKTAIKEEQVAWPQIFDSEGTATGSYGVDGTGIPHLILFGPDGTILERDIERGQNKLRGENMIKTVGEYLEAEKE
ncbi:MAG: AhpC/TSA family protein [Bacteroidales bacterium]|nr:AhpC/TSA family protein [Bacteroidales bacterium]